MTVERKCTCKSEFQDEFYEQLIVVLFVVKNKSNYAL